MTPPNQNAAWSGTEPDGCDLYHWWCDEKFVDALVKDDSESDAYHLNGLNYGRTNGINGGGGTNGINGGGMTDGIKGGSGSIEANGVNNGIHNGLHNGAHNSAKFRPVLGRNSGRTSIPHTAVPPAPNADAVVPLRRIVPLLREFPECQKAEDQPMFLSWMVNGQPRVPPRMIENPPMVPQRMVENPPRASPRVAEGPPKAPPRTAENLPVVPARVVENLPVVPTRVVENLPMVPPRPRVPPKIAEAPPMVPPRVIEASSQASSGVAEADVSENETELERVQDSPFSTSTRVGAEASYSLLSFTSSDLSADCSADCIYLDGLTDDASDEECSILKLTDSDSSRQPVTRDRESSRTL